MVLAIFKFKVVGLIGEKFRFKRQIKILILKHDLNSSGEIESKEKEKKCKHK